MIPFIDLSTQQGTIRQKIESRIQAVLDHGKYINGPEVEQLEERLSRFCGVRHAIGCSSGTDALLLALMACDVGPGDAILTTPFTFIATAEVISLLGATPVFVDIDPHSYNISPEGINKALQALTAADDRIHPLPAVSNTPLVAKGIIAVDLFGMPAEYDALNAIAEKNDLFVIEDAAQSFGATYNGRKTCSLSKIGCTSFFPAKPLGCYGDGGMCFTDDDEIYQKLNSLRIHGKGKDKYDNVRIGINGRLDTFQAAILLEKFEIFQEEFSRRQKVARIYEELLSGFSILELPKVPKHMASAWAQFSILAPDEPLRDLIMQTLKENLVPTAIYYPKPLHCQGAFKHLQYKHSDFKVSEAISKKIFSLPFHPYMAPDVQSKIAETIQKIEKEKC